MKHSKIFLSVILSITLLGMNVLPVSAFLLPTNLSGTNLSPQSTLSTSSDNELIQRNELGGSNRIEDRVPKATMLITPTNPRVDEAIYAQAMPEGFMNSPTKLYYNWYIYNPNPEIGTVVIKDGKKILIPSNTMEGALIRGAAAQARGDYIPGTTPKAKDIGTASESNEKDNDGYLVTYGGDGGRGAIEKEIKDILGKNYDFTYSDFEDSCEQNCDVKYDNELEEAEWEYKKCFDPECTDWFTTCCTTCQSTYATCMTDFWTEVEEDCMDELCSDHKKERKKDCLRTLTSNDYLSCDSDFKDEQSDCKDTRNTCCLNTGSCGAKPSQDCVECEQEYYEDQWEARKAKNLCEKKCEVNENQSLGSPSVEPVGSRCFRYNFGGVDVKSHITGIFQPITCTHFFPGADNPGKSNDWAKDTVLYEPGDGSFAENEEIFWGTDETNSDTDGDGFSDEEDIVGLGQQTIKFTYKSGDQLGVVVEGTSTFPTNENTPYYKIMWAHTDQCDAQVIEEWKDTKFENLCECKRRKDGKCDKSDDFGFGYLATTGIFQRAEESLGNSLNAVINSSNLRPVVGKPLELETIVTGNQLEKDLLFYQWSIQHEGSSLDVSMDAKNSRLVWKKEGIEIAYANVKNRLADLSSGGMGWNKLNFIPLLEGRYIIVDKITETVGTSQKMGEAIIPLEVTERLNLRFFRAYQEDKNWKKGNEITNGLVMEGEQILVEYDGSLYEDFSWYVNKQSWEGNNPSLLFRVALLSPAEYRFKLVAANRNRTNVTEDESLIKVVKPSVKIKPRDQELEEKIIYKVPYNESINFIAWKSPDGSSFAARGDLTYVWSFDDGTQEEGKQTYSIKLEEDKHLIRTPHTLSVMVYDIDNTLIAEDKITLIPYSKDVIAEKSESLNNLAFAYLNISDRFKFTLQTVLWVCFLYLLLSSIAWLSRTGEK